jgi:hypothetical protein
LSISEFKSLRISYGALVYIFSAIMIATFGAAAWMTTINNKLETQGDSIEALKSVDKRLSHVETLLEDLRQQKINRERQ